MPLDPNIPLSGIAPVNALQLAQAQGVGLHLRQQQQDMAAQDAIRNVFANPASIDPATGMIRPEAIRNVFAVSPVAGMKLVDQMQQQETHRAQMLHYKALTDQETAAAAQKRQDSALKMLPHIIDINARMNVLYDQRIAAGATPEQARQDVLGLGNEQVDGLAQSGVLGGSSEVDRFKQGVAGWDRTKSGVMVQRSKDILAAQVAQQRAEQKQEERPAKWTANGFAFRPGTTTALDVNYGNEGWVPYSGTPSVPPDLKPIGGPEINMYTNVVPPTGGAPALGLNKGTGHFENIPTKEGTQIGGGYTGTYEKMTPVQQAAVDTYATMMVGGDNTWRTGLSRNKGGAELIRAVDERFPQKLAELGISPAEAGTNKAIRIATQAALTQNAKDITMLRPYVSMLDQNSDILKGLSEKVVRTNAALANRPLLWLQKNASDNPDVFEYLAQIEIVKNEATRVISNPRLVGQMTDTARQEIEQIINGSMPLNATARVLERIKNDGHRRITEMEVEQQGLQGKLKSMYTGSGAGESAGKPKVVNFSDLP